MIDVIDKDDPRAPHVRLYIGDELVGGFKSITIETDLPEHRRLKPHPRKRVKLTVEIELPDLAPVDDRPYGIKETIKECIEKVTAFALPIEVKSITAEDVDE